MSFFLCPSNGLLSKKSHYPPTGYSGYVDELSNHLNTAVISYASVCILQAGAFRILQKIFQKLCPFFGIQTLRSLPISCTSN